MISSSLRVFLALSAVTSVAGAAVGAVIYTSPSMGEQPSEIAKDEQPELLNKNKNIRLLLGKNATYDPLIAAKNNELTNVKDLRTVLNQQVAATNVEVVRLTAALSLSASNINNKISEQTALLEQLKLSTHELEATTKAQTTALQAFNKATNDLDSATTNKSKAELDYSTQQTTMTAAEEATKEALDAKKTHLAKIASAQIELNNLPRLSTKLRQTKNAEISKLNSQTKDFTQKHLDDQKAETAAKQRLTVLEGVQQEKQTAYTDAVSALEQATTTKTQADEDVITLQNKLSGLNTQNQALVAEISEARFHNTSDAEALAKQEKLRDLTNKLIEKKDEEINDLIAEIGKLDQARLDSGLEHSEE